MEVGKVQVGRRLELGREESRLVVEELGMVKKLVEEGGKLGRVEHGRLVEGQGSGLVVEVGHKLGSRLVEGERKLVVVEEGRRQGLVVGRQNLGMERHTLGVVVEELEQHKLVQGLDKQRMLEQVLGMVQERRLLEQHELGSLGLHKERLLSRHKLRQLGQVRVQKEQCSQPTRNGHIGQK